MSPVASMFNMRQQRGRKLVFSSIQSGFNIPAVQDGAGQALPQLIILFLHLGEVSIDDDQRADPKRYG
jgi:hypothetical protein